MRPMTSFITCYGRFELWSPSNIFRYLCWQGHKLQSLVEFLGTINLSLSPDIKTTVVFGSNRFTASFTSKSYTSQFAFLSTSSLSLEKTQGKKQFIIKLGTGVLSFATCLHKLLKHLQEESATMNQACPQSKDVAAPILLPHKITLYFKFLRYQTIVFACSASLYPRLIVSTSSFFPQPMKSNEAKDMPSGKYLTKVTAQSLHEELPCMQRMIQLLWPDALQTVNSKFLSKCGTLQSYLIQYRSLQLKTFAPTSPHKYLIAFSYIWLGEASRSRSPISASLKLPSPIILDFLSSYFPFRTTRYNIYSFQNTPTNILKKIRF